MAVTSAAFNFQPASSSIPTGYLADSGKTFTSQNGLQYGWTLDNTRDTRDRNTAADGRLDTLIQFNNSKWEVAVPNGTYSVSLTAGDASYIDSTFAIAAEGKTILSGKPTASNHFINATANVVVTDGRLTLGKANGAVNNKLNSVSFTAIDTAGGAAVAKPSAPTWISSWSDTTNSANVKWNDTSRNESGFIIERSLDNKGWSEIARVGANVTSFTATGLNAGTKYYFRVKAYNAGGTSGISPVENATTLKGGATVTKPSVVGGVTLTANNSTSVTVKWNDLSNESGYRVDRSTDKTNFTNIGNLGSNTTSLTDSTVKASTKYYYRITAFNSAGSSSTGAYAVTTNSASSGSTKPTAPSWLGAKANGSSAATLTWGDVSNESGYIIERTSSNGYIETARVGTNVTTHNVTGLYASTSYSFRVKAYNAGGTSAASVIQTIKTATAASNPTSPNNPSSPPPSLPTGAAAKLAGINANDKNAAASKNALNDVGVKYVRLAMKSDWSNLDAANGWYADQAREYKAAGFKVMLVVMPTRPTSYNQAKSFYSALANNSSLRNAVDYWQIGNEPNIGKFWSGTADQYVKTSLKPASEAFRAVGETVVGGGPSWDVNYVKQLVSLGYNNYVDYAAFHPYGNGAAESISRAQGAKAAFGNKPVMFTEWSVSGYEGNASKWAAENTKVANALSSIGALSFYYGLYTDSSRVGGGSIMHTNGSKNTAHYNAMKDWLN